jgi:hypothetical protein
VIDRAAKAVKDKVLRHLLMGKKGWNDPEFIDTMKVDLADCVEREDYLDAIAYLIFLQYHEWKK